MKFSKTTLKGSYIIEIEKRIDKRGFFARTYDFNEFKKRNLETNFTVSAISKNIKKATLRGVHYQKEPYGETKIVRVIRGSIYDVIIDLRANSSTYRKHFAIVLKDSEYKSLYVPKDFAHGFITLEEDTEVFYQIAGSYNPDFAKGIRWNDIAFNINWPIKPKVISSADNNLANYV